MALTAQQIDNFNRQILRFVRQMPEPADAVNVLGSALASMLAAQWYDEPAKIQRALDRLRAETLDAAAANRASPTALVVTLGERRGKLAPATARVFMSGAPLDEAGPGAGVDGLAPDPDFVATKPGDNDGGNGAA